MAHVRGDNAEWRYGQLNPRYENGAALKDRPLTPRVSKAGPGAQIFWPAQGSGAG